MWTKRAGDLMAAFVVGNGVLDLIAPRQRGFLWIFGPEGLRKRTLWFADHPTAMRLQGIAKVGTGIWLALKQYREAPQPSSWHQRWSSKYRQAGLLAPVGLLVAILLFITVFFYRRSRSEAARNKGKSTPSVARVIELSATSEESFEDAINQGVKRATSTLRNVESAWIKDMNVLIENNKVAAYKVNMTITFVLEEGEQGSVMEHGRIAWYSVNLGHGFIIPEAGGPKVFLLRENIVAGQEKTLETNDMVSYEVTQSGEGPEAKNVSKV